MSKLQKKIVQGNVRPSWKYNVMRMRISLDDCFYGKCILISFMQIITNAFYFHLCKVHTFKYTLFSFVQSGVVQIRKKLDFAVSLSERPLYNLTIDILIY